MARGRATDRFGAPDREAYRRGFHRVCGLDEVGRGPLAGPVVAAAVVLPPDAVVEGLGDSKALTARQRALLVPVIQARAVAWALGMASAAEVDRINVLEASLLAMQRALEGLPVAPDHLLVDGIHPLRLEFSQETLVKGDARSAAVAAASVLAKEHRDALMCECASVYPGYGFEVHKGYPTAAHRDSLRRLGPSPIHRTSFRTVRELSSPPRQTALFSTA